VSRFSLRLPERTLGGYVPLFDHASPYVVLLKDGSALVVLQVDGLPVQTLDDDLVYRTRRSLNHALCGIATTAGLVLYSWTTRGFADSSCYPGGEFRSTFARNMDARYREKLFDRFLFLNRSYIGIMIRPPRLAGEWIGDQIGKRRRSRDVADEQPEERIRRLLRVTDILMGDLEAYKPRLLGLRESRGVVFSEVAEALAFAMTGVWRSVGLQAGRRLGDLFSERIIVGRESIEIRGPGRSSWAACFGARHLMHPCPPGVLDGFLSASFRSTVAQSFRFIGQADALSLMGRKQNRMLSANDRAHSQIAQLDDAMDDVQSGRMAMGDHGLVITTFTDDLAALSDVANSAWHVLQDAGAQVAREDDALEAAYFSMLPGNLRYRPRPGVVSTRNYASLASMHAYPAGEDQGHWGEPLALFRTTGGTPYRFHLHVNRVGNTFVFGESGSGKTALLGFLITQSERLGIQVVLWDKDRGLEILTRAVGGRYLTLRNPTGLAPLKALTDAPEDIHHLAQLARGLIRSTSGYILTPEEDRRLYLGLRAVMALPVSKRRLGEVRAFLGSSRTGAGAHLEKWCAGGEYGWVLDNDEDQVRLDAPVLGFDVTEFLTDPMVCGPVMTYLLHRTGKLDDGRRLLYIIDEGWRVVDIPAFADAAKDGLKTDRKKNAATIFATQSVRDALDSGIGETIREQCKTIIGFPIERPKRQDFRELKFSERECDIIEELQPGTGQFLLSQGRRSIVAQLPLRGLTDEIAVLSGNETNVRLLDELRSEVGDDPERLIEAFQQNRRAA
jgi:type IV secretion system protein VirB4